MNSQSAPFLPQTGFVRRPVVLAHIPFGPTKLYEEVKAGRFPKPVKLGERISAWRAEEIHAWIARQGRDDLAVAK